MSEKKLDKTIKEKFRERFREILSERNWSNEDLLNALSEFEGTPEAVSPKTITNWRTGKSFPHGEMLVPLSNVLGVTIDYLLCVNDYNLVEEALNAVLGKLEESRRIVIVKPVRNNNTINCFMFKSSINWGDMYNSSEQNQYSNYPVSQEYVISSIGNIYTIENYDILGNKETETSETIYSIVNKAVELNKPKLISRIRRAYNKNRPYLGVLGELFTFDEFLRLSYIIGYLAKKK
jgi:transcriptional regulator with XRE-family HTH domain